MKKSLIFAKNEPKFHNYDKFRRMLANLYFFYWFFLLKFSKNISFNSKTNFLVIISPNYLLSETRAREMFFGIPSWHHRSSSQQAQQWRNRMTLVIEIFTLTGSWILIRQQLCSLEWGFLKIFLSCRIISKNTHIPSLSWLWPQ